MSRTQKLLTAIMILAGGLLLAWPFRRTESVSAPPQIWQSMGLASDVDAGGRKLRRAGTVAPTSESLFSGPHTPLPSAPTARPESPTVAASSASLERSTGGEKGTFPVEERAAPWRQTRKPTPPVPSQVGDSLDGVIYAKVAPGGPSIPDDDGDDEATAPYLRYVIHNGDTLDKLAERYLGSAVRALELFDLNREVLTNPHLLPIGAEIRIPRS